MTYSDTLKHCVCLFLCPGQWLSSVCTLSMKKSTQYWSNMSHIKPLLSVWVWDIKCKYSYGRQLKERMGFKNQHLYPVIVVLKYNKKWPVFRYFGVEKKLYFLHLYICSSINDSPGPDMVHAQLTKLTWRKLENSQWYRGNMQTPHGPGHEPSTPLCWKY